MVFNEERFQRCKGRLANLTQTGAEVMTAVEGSNDGLRGFMNRHYKIYSDSFLVSRCDLSLLEHFSS